MAKVVLRRVGGEDSKTIQFNPVTPGNANRLDVRFEGFQGEVVLDGFEEGMGLLWTQGRVHRFYAMRENSMVQVWVDGRIHRFELAGQTARRSQAAHASAEQSELIAPMPGTVLKVCANQGSDVAAHQPMVIMESMKMEMSLSVPHSGRVKEILCREGQLVEMGAVLVRMETTSHDTAPA